MFVFTGYWVKKNFQSIPGRNDNNIRALTAMTRPPVDKLPMLTINTSFFVSLATFAPFLSPRK